VSALRPTAPLAPRVLLPGDPGRALALAQVVLGDDRRMFNHHRGLWGYTGTAADGEPLTIQSTGMGGPSTAIVAEELIGLGARRLVRVGTSGGLAGQALGTLLVAGTALCEDGASRALGAGERAEADAELTAALERGAGPAVVIASADLFYDPDTERPGRWIAAGAVAVEMEAATLFTVARRHGVAAGCLLTVSDLIPSGERIGDDELHAAELRLGDAATAAL
jgi:uridine phosphorylase